MFTTIQVGPDFYRGKPGVFCEGTTDPYHPMRHRYSALAEQYFRLPFAQRLQMVRSYSPSTWKETDPAMRYDSVLVLRQAFNERGI